MSTTSAKNAYFDLNTTGLGYLNRVREVIPAPGESFWSVSIAALRGHVDAVQHTRFECRVSGKSAQQLVRQLKPAVEGDLKVLIAFTLSDLTPESFEYKHGERAGQVGVGLKARLIKITWAKVDGVSFYQDHAA